MSQDQNYAETEIEPLSDEALEEVSGGAAGVCSVSDCSNTTVVVKPTD